MMQTVDFVDNLLPSTKQFKKPAPTFTEFKQSVWRTYQHAPHQSAIDEVLTGISDYILSGGKRGIKKAMIFMPPRHGKTMSVSRMFPAWMLGLDPSLRIIMTSYGATLAGRNSRTVRNLLETNDYKAVFPHVTISRDTSAKYEWDTTEGGGLIAAGVGGGVTGHGGHLLIVDDPIKSRMEAESETYRERTIDWYINDLLTRLEEPGGAIILMLTRWHMYDLAGYLLDSEPDDWHVLSLPALAEENDPLGRDVGQALWESHYSAETLGKRKQQMGEYAFASLYQQRPMPSKAGLFDTSKIKIIDPSTVPDLKSKIRFYDLAVTAKKTSDYTAGCLLGIDKDENAYILHMYRVQKNPVNVKDDIIQQAQIDGTDVRIRLEAENSARVQLDYMLREPALHNYSLDIVKPDGDKYTRATPFASRVNAEKVFMVRGAWNRALLDEMAVFPMGANDDQVDALSGAWHGVSSGHTSFSIDTF